METPICPRCGIRGRDYSERLSRPGKVRFTAYCRQCHRELSQAYRDKKRGIKRPVVAVDEGVTDAQRIEMIERAHHRALGRKSMRERKTG